MMTEDAEIYLGKCHSKLRQGVKDGWLHPYKKKMNGDNRRRWNYYLTSELDAYKEYLKTNKKTNYDKLH